MGFPTVETRGEDMLETACVSDGSRLEGQFKFGIDGSRGAPTVDDASDRLGLGRNGSRWI
jgi:hypothetical protein